MNGIIDGKKTAEEIYETLAIRIKRLKEEHGITPGVATILIGEDEASKVYVNQKHKQAKRLGINSFPYNLPYNSSFSQVKELIEELNKNPEVHGVLVQLPLPQHLLVEEILSIIEPKKDVDGFHPYNIGLYSQEKSYSTIKERNYILPCTPKGIIVLLEKYNVEMSGKTGVILGRSNIVGKPTATLLLACDVTVTICHTKTKDLKYYTKEADILVVAIGKPKVIKEDMVKEGAVVIDVGINRTEEGLVGDVDFERVKEKASLITPVPGGVGPMTVAMLMENTVTLAEKSVKCSLR
jgi:methylenetetrahydrofolate dehydrogenase (NADP+)/methenyltetrahydrofolate cyclohydrolase